MHYFYRLDKLLTTEYFEFIRDVLYFSIVCFAQSAVSAENTNVLSSLYYQKWFFREIMNPEAISGRLDDFLSQMLKRKVRVLKVLPNDSSRIADESSLLIMDIVVELEDGSIANVEMQKIGYLFPGQRCACYSADLLLRQYKMVRGEKKKKFSYRDIKDVYTIVLFEKSPKEFHACSENYCHFFSQKSDTGLQMDFLQKYLLIPLDIFRKNQQNKKISSKRDAWLALFSYDEPKMIIELIEKYPEFRKIYEEGYELCLNTEGVMEMFSKELYELDKNTVQYMIDEMQDTIDAQKAFIEAQNEKIDKMRNEQEKVAIKASIYTMRSLNTSEQDITRQICKQYQMNEEQAKKYL